MTWISLQDAAALCGLSLRHFRRQLSHAHAHGPRTRSGERLANGRRETEVLLESLPAAAQEKFILHPLAFSLSDCSLSSDPLPAPAAVVAGADDAGAMHRAPALAEGDIAGTSPARDGGYSAVTAPPASSSSTRTSTFLTRTLTGLDRSTVQPFNRSTMDLGESELERLNDLAEAIRKAESGNRKAETAARLGWSVSTFERKARALRRYGLAGLARKPRIDRGRPRVADDKVVARIKAKYLTPYRPGAASIYREIARDYEMSGLRPPSYSFVLRTIDQIPPDLLARYRYGEKEFDDKFAFVTLRRKPALPRQWADSDHHLCDHIVEFADGSIGRPWLTAIQDLCTNEILGYTLTREKRSTYPGAGAIALTLRHAILKKDKGEGIKDNWPSFGLFDHFYTDLGRDFRSQHIRAVCHDLNIEWVAARGYHGKSKPIERFFGVMEEGLKKLPGYVGGSVETNPLAAGIGPTKKWEDLRGQVLPVDDFERELRSWIVNDFHHAASRPLGGLSPLDVLEAHVKNGWRAREVASERALDLLLMHRKSKKVQRFGIEMFGAAGRQRFFAAPELLDLIGQEVEVYWTPENLGELVVYCNNRFLCKATNRELLDFGASEETLARERELKRQQRRSVEERYQQMLISAQYSNELERAAAEERYEKVFEEERQKIAVNATAQSVATILPKYQRAERALSAAPVSVKRVPDRGRERGRGSEVAGTSTSTNPWMTDEEKPVAFTREKNEWLDEDS